MKPVPPKTAVWEPARDRFPGMAIITLTERSFAQSTIGLAIEAVRTLLAAGEEPAFIAMQGGGDAPPEFFVRFSESIDDFAQQRFVDADNLGHPILPKSGFPDLKFKVGVHH